MFRFETAGESHGECLVATLTGLPSGVPVSLERINLSAGFVSKIERYQTKVVSFLQDQGAVRLAIVLSLLVAVGALFGRRTKIAATK